MGAISSYDAIPSSSFAGVNVVIFGFADTSLTTMAPTTEKQIQKAMSGEMAGTVNFLSLGGEHATPITFNSATTGVIAQNIIAQINNFNSKNPIKIDGVDLDLEQGIDSSTIAELAKIFKQAGLKVGAAPQVYLSNGSNIDSKNPSNLVLTSGGGGTAYDRGRENVYQLALNANNLDYIFVQTYNTKGFTIDGVDEANIHFVKNAAKALNSAVKTQCSSTTLCVPSATKIVMGTVSNKYAGWFTPFDGNTTAADQKNTLDVLKADIDSMVGNPDYSNFAGTMVWSLNMDYAANLYSSSNTAYSPGGFSENIFGAEPAPTVPYFTIQITNNAPNSPNRFAYASVTLVENNNYWIFGNKWDQPIVPGGMGNNAYQLWGTLPSSKDVPGVQHSSSLDNILSGKDSFAAKVQVNGYADNSSMSTPTGSFLCRSSAGTNYNFKAGKSYNIIINATDNNGTTAACDITES